MSLFGSAAAIAGLVGGFGQFGFGHVHELATFHVGPAFFRAKAPGGFDILLGPERTGFVVTQQSRYAKTLEMRGAPRSPYRIHFETASLGFSLQYGRGGIEMAAKSVPAPFISWSDGTVGPGVPSAVSSWALLSWAEARPPILLCFASAPASVTAIEESDGFRLVCKEYAGSVRVRLPFGSESLATIRAADFGEAIAKLKPRMAEMARPAPSVIGAAVVEDAQGLTAVWKFDSPGALVPIPANSGVTAGSLKIISQTGAAFVGGDRSMKRCAGDELRIRFMASKLFPGAALVVSQELPEGVGPHLVDKALAFLAGNVADVRLVDDLHKADLAALFATEPISGIGLPYAATGFGSTDSASRLLASLSVGTRPKSVEGLLGSIDWVTWLPAGVDAAERTDAAGFIAVAGGLLRSSEERVLAAMANAGAANGPLSRVRRWLYPNQQLLSVQEPGWWSALHSPVRLLSPGMFLKADGDGFLVESDTQATESVKIEVQSDAPLQILGSSNLEQVFIIGEEPFTVRARPVAPGPWRLRLGRRVPGRAIPRAAPSPRYSGDPR
ncbi:MAG: hypothetical protein ACR2HJ_12620 [Fimbriimonadales bacterium]